MELKSSKDNFRMIKRMKIFPFQYSVYSDWSLILCRIIFCVTYLVLLGLQETNIECFSIFREKPSEHVNSQALDATFMSSYFSLSYVD